MQNFATTRIGTPESIGMESGAGELNRLIISFKILQGVSTLAAVEKQTDGNAISFLFLLQKSKQTFMASIPLKFLVGKKLYKNI